MFRFLRPNLVQCLKRPFPLRLRPKAKVLTRPRTLATAAVTLSALAFHTSSNEPTQFPTEPNSMDQTPLSSLLRAYLVFSLCSLPSLVDASPSILRFLLNIPLLRNVSEAFLKVTFFDQFVGAETVDACLPLLHKLRRSNQGVLFCYSVEHPNENGSTLNASQRALESILRSIEVAADFEDSLLLSSSPNTPEAHRTGRGTWVAIKLSTLVPQPETGTEVDPTRNALWVLSEWIVRRHASYSRTNPKDVHVPFPGAPDEQDFQLFLDQGHSNVPTNTDLAHHIQTLVALYSNLRKICTRAQARGVRLTIDAEETWLQPAIDLFSILLMQEFNSRSHSTDTQSLTQIKEDSIRAATHPLVYATLQAYLVRAPTFLDFLIAHASENQYALGVKLVRGAYVDAEMAEYDRAHPHTHSLSLSSNSPPASTAEAEQVKTHQSKSTISISPDQKPPTHPSKEVTDAAFDACVRVLVGEVARDMGPGTTPEEGRIAVLFGTHNWKSSRLVLDEMLRLGLGKEVVDSESDLGDERNEVRREKDDRSLETASTEKKIALTEEVRRRICMAQLYGMSDSLAAYIVDRTQTIKEARSSSPFVIRYMPYGPLRDVMPYLARRAVENQSVLGSSVSGRIMQDGVDTDEVGRNGAAEERKRIGKLIWQRVVGFWRF